MVEYTPRANRILGRLVASLESKPTEKDKEHLKVKAGTWILFKKQAYEWNTKRERSHKVKSGVSKQARKKAVVPLRVLLFAFPVAIACKPSRLVDQSTSILFSFPALKEGARNLIS